MIRQSGANQDTEDWRDKIVQLSLFFYFFLPFFKSSGLISSVVFLPQQVLAVCVHRLPSNKPWSSQPEPWLAVIRPNMQQSQHVWKGGGEGGDIERKKSYLKCEILRRKIPTIECIVYIRKNKETCKGHRYWLQEGGTLEILVSQGSPWKKGLSQAPCSRAILMPLSQSWSRAAAAQHCSWAIL